LESTKTLSCFGILYSNFTTALLSECLCLWHLKVHNLVGRILKVCYRYVQQQSSAHGDFTFGWQVDEIQDQNFSCPYTRYNAPETTLFLSLHGSEIWRLP